MPAVYPPIYFRRNVTPPEHQGYVGPGGIVFPYLFDPSGVSDFPDGWGGSDTVVISEDGVIVNSPILDDELLPDPGMETYAGEDCTMITFDGGVRTKLTSGQHGGLAAQGLTTEEDKAAEYTLTPLAQEWYKFVEYAKRISGSGGTNIAMLIQGVIIYFSRNITETDWTKKGCILYTVDTADIAVFFNYCVVSGPEDLAFDDASLKRMIKTSLCRFIRGGVGFNVGVRMNWDTNNVGGCYSHGDGSMDNCLIAYYINYPDNPILAYCELAQIVGGVRTVLITDESNSPTDEAGGLPTSSQWLEIRRSGTDVQLWHNDIQVGADVAVPAQLVNQTAYGLFDTGGNEINMFFCGAPI